MPVYDAVFYACLSASRFSSLLSSLAISPPLSSASFVGPHRSLLSPGPPVTQHDCGTKVQT